MSPAPWDLGLFWAVETAVANAVLVCVLTLWTARLYARSKR